MTKPGIELWLSTSQALFSGLVPKDTGERLFALDVAAHAALVDREAEAVNKALLDMALSEGESDVKAIVAGLSEGTAITLCSRWLHFHKAWMMLSQEPSAPLWEPPGKRDLWRAIFLQMLDDKAAAAAALKFLWPEVS